MKSKKLNFIVLLIFTILVLYYTLKDNYDEVITHILQMNPIWFIYSVILMFIYWIFKGLITRKYVRYYNKDYSLFKGFRLQLETMFFNGITPFSSGGGPFQVLSLKKDGLRITNGANIMVIIALLQQLSFFTFMTISVIANRFLNLFPASITIRNLSIFGYIICLIFIIFLLLIMFNDRFNECVVDIAIKILSKTKLIKNKNIVIEKWHSYINSLNEGSKIIRRNRKDFCISYLYNLIALLSYILVPYAVAMGMNIDIDISKVIITTSYVLMIGMFVPMPGGTGGLEFAFNNLYSNFISGNLVGSLMLMWRFITYYLGIVLGGIVLNFRKRSM